eukprot:6187694-Pleurochrysis_carterae.AAC.4
MPTERYCSSNCGKDTTGSEAPVGSGRVTAAYSGYHRYYRTCICYATQKGMDTSTLPADEDFAPTLHALPPKQIWTRCISPAASFLLTILLQLSENNVHYQTVTGKAHATRSCLPTNRPQRGRFTAICSTARVPCAYSCSLHADVNRIEADRRRAVPARGAGGPLQAAAAAAISLLARVRALRLYRSPVEQGCAFNSALFGPFARVNLRSGLLPARGLTASLVAMSAAAARLEEMLGQSGIRRQNLVKKTGLDDQHEETTAAAREAHTRQISSENKLAELDGACSRAVAAWSLERSRREELAMAKQEALRFAWQVSTRLLGARSVCRICCTCALVAL